MNIEDSSPVYPSAWQRWNLWFARETASPRLLWIFVLCGVAVRVRQYFFAASYWYDEAYVILPIRERGFLELLGPQPYHLVSPPLFLWITRALYKLGGDGELLMRLPGFLAGIAALLLMIPLARLIMGKANALWPVAFLAIARKAMVHGCEVHPYAMDLLLAVWTLYCTALFLDDAASSKARRMAFAGLLVAATFGQWLSFPSAFSLGGASLALMVYLIRRKPAAPGRLWLAWIAFNGVTALSGLALWWFSGRHMYYHGMIQDWGSRGWGGFPDWQNPVATVLWVLNCPVSIGNYGTRELGIILALLALTGGWQLAKKSPMHAVLLTMPFFLAILAALLGKYPVAERTGFFLLPSLWLLAARGIGWILDRGRQHGREWAGVLVFLLAWDFIRLGVQFAHPDPQADYRGAYQFVHSQRRSNDCLWAQMSVVHQVYYGLNDSHVLTDAQLNEAVEKANTGRLWVVEADNRPDLQKRFTDTGSRLVLSRHFSRLNVFLFEPAGQ